MSMEDLIAKYAADIPEDWDTQNDWLDRWKMCETCDVHLTKRHDCEKFQAEQRKRRGVGHCDRCGKLERDNHRCSGTTVEAVEISIPTCPFCSQLLAPKVIAHVCAKEPAYVTHSCLHCGRSLPSRTTPHACARVV